MRPIFFATVFLIASQFRVDGLSGQQNKGGKFLSMFNVVSFPNDACDAGTRNGTCYTKEECSNKGGMNEGSCAQGYGVCCTFVLNGGVTTSENNSYFESTGSESGTSALTVCKASSDICQLRLDFQTFVITGPSIQMVAELFTLNGEDGILAANGIASNTASRCLTDTFQVTGQNPAPPLICGTNTGEHMYVDASDDCNVLAFTLGETAIGNTITARSWMIRITQYKCSFQNLAPTGCTQYFTATSGTIQSYNYNNRGSYHLADQNQVICFRRADNQCRICFSTTAIDDFDISAAPPGASPVVSGVFSTDCCRYGDDGMGINRDCIQIPDLTGPGNGNAQLIFTKFCGGAGLGSAKNTKLAAANARTICSKRVPFRLTFSTDSFETTTESAGLQAGFKLNYQQMSC